MEQPGTIGKVHSNNYSFWVQDTWEMTPRLTINAGVRTENEHIPSFKDQTQFPDALDITFGFKDKIAPRLGFAYDVKGDGKWKTYGSYGWFYDITKLELPRGSFGGDHWIAVLLDAGRSELRGINCGEGTPVARAPTSVRATATTCATARTRWTRLFEEYFNRPGMTGHRPEPQAGEDRRSARAASSTS